MSESTRVHITQQRDQCSPARTVLEQVRILCAESPPQLAWAEPSPRLLRRQGRWQAGRHEQFQSLVAGAPDWPEDLQLSEARLFWPDRAVHLLAVGAGCVGVTLTETGDGTAVLRSEQQLLGLCDGDRFGLRGLTSRLPAGLTAIEYRFNGRVLAWRMVLR